MSDIELTVERPAAGGRMIARHEGRVVLVAGAIPGERVRARLERPRGGSLFATTVEVIEPSPDRRDPGEDPRCGGRDFAHIRLERQRALKAEIVVDAFRRLARQPLAATPAVHGSPEEGYRMRARLHVRDRRVGFYRESTHELCDPGCPGQLRGDTLDVLRRFEAALPAGVTSGALELSENRDASARALLLDISAESVRARAFDDLLATAGATGIGVTRGGRPLAERGSPHVADTLELSVGGRTGRIRLQRHVAGFFQGNRFLLQPLVERVLAQVPDGPLADLYAGAGLFGLAHAALGRGHVLAVESDPSSAAELTANGVPYEGAVEVVDEPVEQVVGRRSALANRTILVDPPRTGLSPATAAGLAALKPPRIVYLSCDVATLARDVGRLMPAGYRLDAVEIFDLFPGTAHVETLAVLAT